MEIERISRLLEKTFEKQPWFGPSLKEVISDIRPDIVHHRYGSTHSIIELILHMTSWRKFAASRLMGDETFAVTDELNFPKAGTWDEALSGLYESQKTLLAAVQSFQESKLGELVPGSSHKYTFYTLLHGVVQHDIYHLGQISYIKKSLS